MRGKLAQIAFGAALAVLPGVARAQGQAGIVVVAGAGMYELPAKSIGKKVEVAPQTPVRVLDQQGSWYVVRAVDLVGWMQKHTIRLVASSRPRAQPSKRHYTLLPNGACYYRNGSGRRVYVQESLCS